MIVYPEIIKALRTFQTINSIPVCFSNYFINRFCHNILLIKDKGALAVAAISRAFRALFKGAPSSHIYTI